MYGSKRRKRTHSFRNNIFFTGTVRLRDGSKALPDSTKITFFLQRDVTVYEVCSMTAPDDSIFPLLMDFWNNDANIHAAGKQE